MKIFTGIVCSVLGLAVGLPTLSYGTGFFVGRSPKLNSTRIAVCSNEKKDKYGNCPFTGVSQFRYQSVGGSGSTGGRSGSGSGGGK